MLMMRRMRADESLMLGCESMQVPNRVKALRFAGVPFR